MFDGGAVLAPSVIAAWVLGGFHRQVAQIEDKSKTKLAVWSYLQRHVREQLENDAPPTTIEMGVVHINYKIDNVKVNNR